MLGRKVLLWLCYSFRPMLLDERQDAISVEADDEDFDPEGMFAAEVLLISCAGLVSIEAGTKAVRSVNFSIKEHLGNGQVD